MVKFPDIYRWFALHGFATKHYWVLLRVKGSGQYFIHRQGRTFACLKNRNHWIYFYYRLMTSPSSSTRPLIPNAQPITRGSGRLVGFITSTRVNGTIILRRQRLIKFPQHYCKSVKNYVVEYFDCRNSTGLRHLYRGWESVPSESYRITHFERVIG